MPSEVGFSVVTCGSSPISRNARPGFGPRANLRALADRGDEFPFEFHAPRHLHQAAQAFAGHQHQIVERLVDETADPGLDRRRIGGVVDGEHRTLQHIRALLGEQPGKLRLLARFQDQDAVAVQSVSHDAVLVRIACCLFIMMPRPGLAQGRGR